MKQNEYVLTPKELVFCAACVGVFSIAGVVNPWEDADDVTIDNEKDGFMEHLEEKGYGTISFFEGFSMDSGLAAALIACGQATRFVIAELRDEGGDAVLKMLYQTNNGVISLEFAAQQYTLHTAADDGTVCNCNLLDGVDFAAAEGEPLRMPTEIVVKAREENDLAAITAQGASLQIAKLVLAKDSCLLSAVLVKPGLSDQLVVLFSDNIGIQITSAYTLEEEVTVLTPLSGQTAKQQLQQLFDKLAKDESVCQTV